MSTNAEYSRCLIHYSLPTDTRRLEHVTLLCFKFDRTLVLSSPVFVHDLIRPVAFSSRLMLQILLETTTFQLRLLLSSGGCYRLHGMRSEFSILDYLDHSSAAPAALLQFSRYLESVR
jgi:hypothetical protein